MEKAFLTETELKELKSLQEQEGNIVANLGEIEYQIMVLNSRKEQLNEEIFTNRKKGEIFAQKLQDKYGEGNINVQTGEFVKS